MMTIFQYQMAQLYSCAVASQGETGGGEGVEVVRNESFDNIPLMGGKFHSGLYTQKIYHLASRIPRFIRMLLPSDGLQILEDAWNAYPYCKTVITVSVLTPMHAFFISYTCPVQPIVTRFNNPKLFSRKNPGYMKEDFQITIESLHMPGKGELPNALDLPADKLSHRQIVMVDIANDPIAEADYVRDEDPSLYRSSATGRGPLTGDWIVRGVSFSLTRVTSDLYHWFSLPCYALLPLIYY